MAYVFNGYLSLKELIQIYSVPVTSLCGIEALFFSIFLKELSAVVDVTPLASMFHTLSYLVSNLTPSKSLSHSKFKPGKASSSARRSE